MKGMMPLASLRFLVVEDHGFQRATMVRALERLGATTIHQAADGRAALAILGDPLRPVDIVISDLEMPELDGMELVRNLGSARAGVSLILASALDRQLLASVATMARAYGVTLLGTLEKPPTPDKLMALIRLHRDRAAPTGTAAQAREFSVAEIAEGLAGDQFEPFFQPKIELGSGRITGAEALARWRHPQHGWVGPAAFIGPMERSGQIDALTWQMIDKAAVACCDWRAGGMDVAVSVNVSAHSLADLDLAGRVTSLVRSRNLAPRFMILELTESAAAGEDGRVLENLARLRMTGFGLAIDDYGAGYSSMQQLARIAFTELKIDQSFVRNAGEDATARVILESSIRMAAQLEIKSVAEGIETRAQFDLLRELRCDVGQGYFMAGPMEGAAYPDWSRGWRPPPGTA